MSRSTLPRPPDAGLSTGQLAELRAMLEEQRDFRIDQLAALRRPHTRARLGAGSREISLVLTIGAHNALNDVLAALHRMDEGSYGSCARCSGAVDVERLEILPQTALCAACQRSTSE
jgi:DnaK suppressor protein